MPQNAVFDTKQMLGKSQEEQNNNYSYNKIAHEDDTIAESLINYVVKLKPQKLKRIIKNGKIWEFWEIPFLELSQHLDYDAEVLQISYRRKTSNVWRF